jgi:hypothetical protein
MTRRRILVRQTIRPAAICGALLVHSAFAQDAAAPAQAGLQRPVMLELIDRLASGGLLKPDDAAKLRNQATQEAEAAIAELKAARKAAADAAETATEAARQLRLQISNSTGAPEGSSLAVARVQAEEVAVRAEQAAAKARASLAAIAPYAGAGAADAAADDGAVRVMYVPEVVKEELREEIRQQVIAQAYEEKWAQPRTFPDWVSRFKFFADVRLRFEGINYPNKDSGLGNDTDSAPPNFNSVNTGSPFNTADTTAYFPRYNVDQDRQRVRLRVRLGINGDLGEGFTSGLRIGTGENNSPVSQNQTLGAASGQGGNFSKFALWLDRGFLKYDHKLLDEGTIAAWAGRFENPFLSTPMIWNDDIGFDGVAMKLTDKMGAFTPFITTGAFPVYNTDLNFASNQNEKFKSTDKWLYAGQTGVTIQLTRNTKLTLAAAVYDFSKVEGRLSTIPNYVPMTSSDAGDTDTTRPSFAQKGNTYMQLRDIDNTTAKNNFGAINQFQYFGLATPFMETAFTGKLDFDRHLPVQISLIGEWVQNHRFDRNRVETYAVNNLSTLPNGNIGPLEASNTGWYVGLKVGDLALTKRWAWNGFLSYRHVGSDAVIDAFTDSDFGNGGTNLKGYTLGGNLALSPRVWIGLRWLSADQVDGARFKNDTFQIDLNGKF